MTEMTSFEETTTDKFPLNKLLDEEKLTSAFMNRLAEKKSSVQMPCIQKWKISFSFLFSDVTMK